MEKLALFNHHPDPAIDFCIEVESLQAIAADRRITRRNPSFRNPEDGSLEKRVLRAMSFRVGGDVQAVAAKSELRALEAEVLAGRSIADVKAKVAGREPSSPD